MKGNKNLRYAIIFSWVFLIIGFLYLYFFHNTFLKSSLFSLFGSGAILGYVAYLIFGCLRGFVLLPVTYLIVAGIIFFPPLPIYILTMIGVLVSSASIYYFSSHLGFDEYFEKNYPKKINTIKEFLLRNELSIVIFWSFAPFLPTDLICYVCGALKIEIKKFLLGVLIGEGISCAIYIFLGKEIVTYVRMLF
jgi:uncharacterized membrane protein YdjX (TVP38/TMEM64 family)